MHWSLCVHYTILYQLSSESYHSYCNLTLTWAIAPHGTYQTYYVIFVDLPSATGHSSHPSVIITPYSLNCSSRYIPDIYYMYLCRFATDTGTFITPLSYFNSLLAKLLLTVHTRHTYYIPSSWICHWPLTTGHRSLRIVTPYSLILFAPQGTYKIEYHLFIFVDLPLTAGTPVKPLSYFNSLLTKSLLMVHTRYNIVSSLWICHWQQGRTPLKFYVSYRNLTLTWAIAPYYTYQTFISSRRICN